MRTIIDIPQAQANELDRLARGIGQSRAALIREAIGDYLKRRAPPREDAFGLWGQNKIDGLDYQEKARAEW